MLDKSLTIVLPIYNGEVRLRECIAEILELASELTSRFRVLVIDDGSTDATYEVAEEIAARYPQVSVLRHRHRRGLGPAIEYAEHRVRSDAVIVHDGVSPIDPNQVRRLWRQCAGHVPIPGSGASSDVLQSAICDFADLPAIHAAMELAHNRVLGFQWVTPHSRADLESLCEPLSLQSTARAGGPHMRRACDMGRIPQLPRPKFLSALAEFALGE